MLTKQIYANKANLVYIPRMTTYIVTDSRGRGLQVFFGEKPKISKSEYTSVQVECACLPGASIDSIRVHLAQQIPKVRPDTIVIAAGICCLTTKTSLGRKRVLLYHKDEQTRAETVNNICRDFRQLHREFTNENCRVILATIPPANIVKYFCTNNPNHQPPDYLEEEQQALIEDIEEVNKCITQINDTCGLPTVDWDRYTYHESLKRRRSGTVRTRKRKFVDLNLPDGVHFNSKLQTQVFSRLYNQLRDLYGDSSQLNTSQESESDNEYNFKRQKNSTKQ